VKKVKIKSLLPWQVKVIIKLLISRLPFAYKFWRSLGIFVHGKMDNSAYAYDVYRKCFDLAGIKKQDYYVLEIGPGDSLATAIVSREFGASKVWLLDEGDYASRDMNLYKMVNEHVKKSIAADNSYNPFDYKNTGEMLQHYNAVYLTQGLRSFVEISDESVDFIFSNAVLEHISKNEFKLFLRETNRVLTSDGVCVHCVDLMDHLAYALNHLRFSEKFWQSGFIRRGGFYTNRIRYGEMLDIFVETGFNVSTENVVRWNLLPTAREKMNEKFKILSEDDLLVSSFTVILKKACGNSHSKVTPKVIDIASLL